MFGKRLLSLLAVGFALTSPPALAETEDYDMSWLDEDKVIYVLQARKYPKVDRFELALTAGMGVDAPFRRSRVYIPKLYHYFTEKFGAAAILGFKQSDENDDFRKLRSDSAVLPSVRDVNSFYGLSFLWMPFYAKMNFFNRLLYMDWHFELGLAQVNTEIDLNFSANSPPNINRSSHLALVLGSGHRYAVSRRFTARFDVLALVYNAATGSGGAITTREKVHKDYQLNLGVGYLF